MGADRGFPRGRGRLRRTRIAVRLSLLTSCLAVAGGVAGLAVAVAGQARAGLAPQLGRTVVVTRIKGTIFVRAPGQARFLLTGSRLIPVKSIVDAGHGTVRLLTAASTHGKTQSAEFSGGEFEVLQSVRSGALTELRLTGGSFSVCKGGAAHDAVSASRSVRYLHGSGHGHFRSQGRYAAATVRGTVWSTIDECDGTRTVAFRGHVVASSDFLVHDLSPGENEIGYCFPRTPFHNQRDYCIAVLSTPSKELVAYGLGLRRPQASQYTLCVLAPSGTNRCNIYPVARHGNSDFEDAVASCEQDEGPGTYLARWYVGGHQLGVSLSFTMTQPHPDFTLPCAVASG